MFMKSFLPAFLSFRGVKFAASYRCNIAQSTGLSSSRCDVGVLTETVAAAHDPGPAGRA
jgi:hypothetical protein